MGVHTGVSPACCYSGPPPTGRKAQGMVNALQTSFVMPVDNNSPFPESFFSYELLGVPALLFKLWCSLLVACQVSSIYLLLQRTASMVSGLSASE
jgi:hypothetical protein